MTNFPTAEIIASVRVFLEDPAWTKTTLEITRGLKIPPKEEILERMKELRGVDDLVKVNQLFESGQLDIQHANMIKQLLHGYMWQLAIAIAREEE